MNRVDWADVVFNSDTGCFERLKQRACRRFCDPIFGEEAFDYAIEMLSKNDWRRLSAFKGNARPETYLTAIFNNLLADFFQRRFGNAVSVPAWLRALGGSAVRVYELLCKKRMEPETIVDWMCARGQHEATWVREQIRTIKQRVPSCGRPVGELAVADVEEHPGADTQDAETPETALARAELGDLLLALRCLLQGPSVEGEPSSVDREQAETMARRVSESTDALTGALDLSDDDRLLLELVYVQGLKVSAAARALGLAEHTARRRLEKLRQQIAAVLEASGITREMLDELGEA